MKSAKVGIKHQSINQSTNGNIQNHTIALSTLNNRSLFSIIF